MIQTASAAAGRQAYERTFIVLDLVQTNAAARHFEQGDMFGARHNDPADVSLYEQFAGIKKVPIEALIPHKLAALFGAGPNGGTTAADG